jgi:hypothetical protein
MLPRTLFAEKTMTIETGLFTTGWISRTLVFQFQVRGEDIYQ